MIMTIKIALLILLGILKAAKNHTDHYWFSSIFQKLPKKYHKWFHHAESHHNKYLWSRGNKILLSLLTKTPLVAITDGWHTFDILMWCGIFGYGFLCFLHGFSFYDPVIAGSSFRIFNHIIFKEI